MTEQLSIAYVTAVSPLAVRLENTAPSLVVMDAPGSVGPLVVGDKVVVARIARTLVIVAVITSTPWIDISYSNSWTNEGSGLQNGQYRRIGDVVTCRGQALHATTTQVGTVWEFPAGFRPPLTTGQVRFQLGGHAGQVGGVRHARTDVLSAGTVSITEWSAATTNPTLYLSNIKFSVLP